MVIKSVDNKKVKQYSLLKTSKARHEQQLFLVEGEHLVYEAYQHHYLVDVLILEGEVLPFDLDFEITYVTYEILKKISSLKTVSHIIGVCQMKEHDHIVGNHLLLLDSIQDPGNLGTIIRSACAFNVDTIILSPDTVDLYNEKVIRATQGMIFNMNIITCDLMKVIPKLKEQHYLVLGTNVNNGADVRGINASKYALVMGNEGQGLKKEIAFLCDQNLYIKMNLQCESLNVGVATSILLYELNKGAK